MSSIPADDNMRQRTTPMYVGRKNTYTIRGEVVSTWISKGFHPSEKLWSENHPGFGHPNKNSRDVGGPFYLVRHVYEDNLPDDPIVAISGSNIWRGYPLPYINEAGAGSNYFPGSAINAPSGLELQALQAAGATAISRCAPTAPAMDSLVTLGELYREGIPTVTGFKTAKGLRDQVGKYQTLKNSGSDYLSAEFGWKPFISDLRKLARVINDENKHLEQLARNSGTVVRRSYKFLTEEQSTETTSPNAIFKANGAGSTVWSVGQGTMHKVVRESKDTWFSGAFTYYFDLEGSKAYEKAKSLSAKARHLYGLKLTPDVLWNLTPWTWAFDWVANTGDIMSNVSMFSNDGLVMRYGYVMRHRRATSTYSIKGCSLKGYGSLDWIEQTIGSESKIRLRASPFGFGIDWDGFTPRQLAIATALGITRGR